ncbi:gastrula zinc finger protein XlCGF52.1 isoform X4 [Cryptotermes secundus]|uniref:gastrula zinc finger protein XlCGF52.1 isoform X4 n=1 Tax=Cryptotermes secundus TaxID=105785 RepID=UPI000CD7CB97|nr:gastrula zinc finger protein XlCGF52.1 isoform X4 [Cryptotermes secundus]
MPRILQRAEEIFPAVRESMSYTNSENVLVGQHSEIYPAYHDGNQAMSIRDEVSDTEEKPDHVPVAVEEIKAEPENYANLEKVLVGPHGEMYAAWHHANEAMNVKIEEVSDAAEEDPLRITVQEMKAEPESAPQNIIHDKQVPRLQKFLHSLATRLPRIVLQRAEETYPAVKESMSYTNTDKVLVGPYGETYPACCNGSQDMNIKTEEDSDAEKKADPLPITFPEVKGEPESTLNELRPVHSEEQPYSRDEHSESFSQQFNLRTHQLIHSGEQTFFCSMCNKSFSCLSHLNRHQRIHSGVRPFSCDVCSKSFTELGDLKRHKRIHTGERPFVCNVCNKSFCDQSNMKTHQRIHSGERPFSCDVCNKSFCQQSDLKKHKIIHTGERPFFCELCNKSFSRKGCMMNHQRIHSEHFE